MLTFGILSALLSAVTQAIAHATLKSGHDKLVIRGLIAAVGGLAMAPVATFTPAPAPVLWGWLALAGLLHTVYQLVLVRAYDAAEFSLVYPIARGVVPVATAAAGLALLGERLTVASISGIAAVSFGLLLIGVTARLQAAGWRWALAAGLLTTLYTAVDGQAVRLAPKAVTFIVWFFLVDAFMMVPLVAMLRGPALWPAVRREGWRGVAAGVASLVTYGSALVALRLLPIGAAAALRETSVVFGVAIARIWLHEPIGSRRAFGAFLIAAGGVMVIAGAH